MALSQVSVDHLKQHVSWPATGSEILEACDNMSDIPEEDRELTHEKIDSDKTYQSADEVISELGK